MFLTALMHQENAVVAVISQMITPAIFILATGSLVSSALVRLGRAVDRSRDLLERMRRGDGGDRDEVDFLMRQLRVYRRRIALIQNMLSLYYVAIFLFVAGSIAIALDVLLSNRFPWLATALVLVGAGCVLWGSAVFLFETRLATGVVRDEIDRAHRDRLAETSA